MLLVPDSDPPVRVAVIADEAPDCVSVTLCVASTPAVNAAVVVRPALPVRFDVTSTVLVNAVTVLFAMSCAVMRIANGVAAVCVIREHAGRECGRRRQSARADAIRRDAHRSRETGHRIVARVLRGDTNGERVACCLCRDRTATARFNQEVMECARIHDERVARARLGAAGARRGDCRRSAVHSDLEPGELHHGAAVTDRVAPQPNQ